jgi:hypothetical protein
MKWHLIATYMDLRIYLHGHFVLSMQVNKVTMPHGHEAS